MSTIRHTNGGIEAGLLAASTDPLPEPRPWQIVDVVTIGNRLERRLILSQTDQHVMVIAERGWWNTYEKHSDIPIQFIGHSRLAYTYTGREQAYRDHIAKVFAPYFNAISHE